MLPFFLSPEAKGIRTLGIFAGGAKKTCGDERGCGAIKHLSNQSASGSTVALLQVPGQEAGSEGFFLFCTNHIGNLCNCDDVMQHIFLTVT